jgi:hypothetical protein
MPVNLSERVEPGVKIFYIAGELTVIKEFFMKKLLLGALALFSVNAFSQSYIILNSGVALTTDNNGFVYDFKHFVLPNKVKGNGGNFLIEDKQLVTIDANGFLYKKETNVKKIQGSGLNYFISEGAFGSRKLFTIDDKGFSYELTPEGMKLKDVKIFGGNYFVLDGTMTLIRQDGTFKVITLEGLDLNTIKSYPGTYFISSVGQFFTINDDGVIKTFPTKFKSITKGGGNYFIDNRGWINTVSAAGELISPIVPAGFNTANLKSFGSNYMIDNNGDIFTVDSEGQIFKRSVELDVTRARVLSIK